MNKEALLDYISDNQPIPRQILVKQLVGSGRISRRSCYYHIDTLINEKRVSFDENKNLVTVAPASNWILPHLLISNVNLTDITNAYANQSPALDKYTKALIEDYGAELTKLLINLLIMLNLTVRGFENSTKFTDLRPVDEFGLEREFKTLRYILDHKHD